MKNKKASQRWMVMKVKENIAIYQPSQDIQQELKTLLTGLIFWKAAVFGYAGKRLLLPIVRPRPDREQNNSGTCFLDSHFGARDRRSGNGRVQPALHPGDDVDPERSDRDNPATPSQSQQAHRPETHGGCRGPRSAAHPQRDPGRAAVVAGNGIADVRLARGAHGTGRRAHRGTEPAQGPGRDVDGDP